MITPLTPIAGVPDGLIVAVNTRLRQISLQADASTAATGGGGTGAPTPVTPVTPVSPTPVGAVIEVHAYGSMDPVLGVITLGVSITPPTDPLFGGCHLYLEIPDQSGGVANTVGVATVGVAAAGGAWAPIDLGVQPYSAATQPWILTLPAPPGVDPTLAAVCRAYASSVSSGVDNPLVRANAHGATPNAQFTIYPDTPGSASGATNVTQLCGPIVPLVLSNDNSTGKLQTPVLVTVSSTPANIPGWSGQLVLVWAGNDPTQPLNQQTVGNIFTTAGPVYGSPDKIPVPHSFAVLTPTTITNATIYAVSGLVNASGVYQWNNLVPGLTPSCGITVGVTTGTTDATSAMLSTLSPSVGMLAGLFGVVDLGITAPLMAPASVTAANAALAALAVVSTSMAASSVTAANNALAALAVIAANMAPNSVTSSNGAIAALAVVAASMATNSITAANGAIASLAVSGANIQLATILGANIAYATIADANIGTCSVSKLTAGSATFSGTATFANGSGPSVAIASGSVTLTAGANTTTLTAGGGIQLANSTYTLNLSSTQIALANGSYNVQLGSGGIALNSAGYALTLSSTQILMSNSTASLTLAASSASLVSGVQSFMVSAAGLTFLDTAVGSGLQLVATTGAAGVTLALQGGTSGFGSVNLSIGSGGAQVTVGTAAVPGATTIGSGTIALSGAPYTILMNGSQVLTYRQTGLGNPTGWADSTALAWAQSLYSKLSTHGLIT